MNLLNLKKSFAENPEKAINSLLSMLKTFGIDLKELAPKAVPFVKAKLVEIITAYENKVGAPVMFSAQLIPGTENISVCVYKEEETEGRKFFTLHASYESKEAENFINKFIENGFKVSATTDIGTPAAGTDN